METIDLLCGLNRYVVLARTLAQDTRTSQHDGLSYAVSLSYNTITMILEETDAGTKREWLACNFEIKGSAGKLKDVSAQSPENEQTARNFILAQSSDGYFPWNVVLTHAFYPPEIERYLSIADLIAKEVYQFDSGDDYRPGFFTEIIATQESVVLKQINWRNARSKDHKDDYFMRELEFFIPLTSGGTSRRDYGDEEYEKIGEMQIRLSDRSSMQNRKGGDLIRNKINSLKWDA